MTVSDDRRTPRQARGIILGCSIGLALSCPAVYNQCFGIYLAAIVRETGWPRAQVSLGYTLPSLLAAALSFPVGVWVDRVGARRVIITGALVFPLVLMAFGSIPRQFSLFVLATLAFGVPLAVLAPPTYLTLPPRWFDRNVGMASALAGIGSSVGAALMPPLTQALVGGQGWRRAAWTIAVIVGVAGTANALLLIRDPPHRADPRPGAQDSTSGASIGEAARDGRFWLLALTFFLIVLVGAGYAVHFVAILADRGYGAGRGALALTCFSLASLVGRLVAGAMLDCLPLWTAGVLFFGAQLIGGAMMLADVGGAAPYVAAALIGGAIGAEVDIMPVTLRHLFGLRAFGRIMGLCFAVFSIGSALGPLVMGVSFDRYGSYGPAMTGLIVADLVAVGLFIAAVGRSRAARR